MKGEFIMKNRTLFHIITLLLLLITFTLFFSACSIENVRTVESDSYTIEWKNGVGYLDFKNGNEKDDLYLDGCVQYADTIEFESISELRETLTQATLDEDQLFTIRNFFPRSEDGRILIIDPQKIAVPTLPSDMMINYVTLKGTSCSFRTAPQNEATSPVGFRGPFHFRTQEQHEDNIRYFENFGNTFDSKDGYELISKTTSTDRNATIYEYIAPAGTFKRVHYVITDGDKTLHISENYRIAPPPDATYPVETSETVPIELNIYGSVGETYFSVRNYSLTARPSIEWLSAWGVTYDTSK